MVATGPSLSAAQASVVRLAQKRRPDLAVVVVNDAYRLFPDALALYACDAKWWDVHEGARDFLGERWNQINVGTPKARDDAQAAERYGLQSVRSDRRKIPHLTGSTIAQGANSGYQAVNLVALWGATDILLLGFDMRVQGTRRHYFGDHPRPLSNASPFPLFLKAFEAAAPVYAAGGVVIRNATPGSALKCFPYVDLEKALA